MRFISSWRDWTEKRRDGCGEALRPTFDVINKSFFDLDHGSFASADRDVPPASAERIREVAAELREMLVKLSLESRS